MFLRLVFGLFLSVIFCATAQETVPGNTSPSSTVHDSVTHIASVAAVKADTSVDLDAVVVKGKHRKFV
jgi:hypothetical protein